MKLMKRVATVALLGAFFLLTACKGGAEGTYKLDKSEMKKSMEAEIAKMPKEQQGMAKLGMALIDAMDMTLVLKSGGEAEIQATMPDLGGKDDEKKDKAEKGKWSQEGDVITLKGDDGKDLKCTLADKKLSCDTGEKSGPKLVFNKEG
jgi:hypothetical protein